MIERSVDLPFPPKNLIFMDGNVDQMRNNAQQLMAPLRLRGLVPGEAGSIYDLGCGYGRIAYWLAESGYTGRYFGCDILKPHIMWLKENLGPALGERFEFQHLDVRNDRYNPTGTIQASDARLPRGRSAPDLALAFSVFTHMYPDDIVHYVGEMAALIGPDTTLWATFFVWDEEAEIGVGEGRAAYTMKHHFNSFSRFHDPVDPLHAISFSEEWIREIFSQRGLRVRERLPGAWCGRGSGCESYQDSFIVTR